MTQKSWVLFPGLAMVFWPWVSVSKFLNLQNRDDKFPPLWTDLEIFKWQVLYKRISVSARVPLNRWPLRQQSSRQSKQCLSKSYAHFNGEKSRTYLLDEVKDPWARGKGLFYPKDLISGDPSVNILWRCINCYWFITDVLAQHSPDIFSAVILKLRQWPICQ